MKRTRRTLLALTLLLAVGAWPAQSQVVSMALALLVDVSGSVDNTEFNLQRTGYVNAFNNPAVWNAISQTQTGSIAASLIYWDHNQYLGVAWTLINSQAAANNFANAINAAPRPGNGLTGIGDALTYGGNYFGSLAAHGMVSDHWVIDISGDGCNNEGLSASTGRTNALAAGVDVINGLAITGSDPGMPTCYNQAVSANGFLVTVNGFEDFGEAIDDKIIRETQETVPEPFTMILLGSGLAGVAVARRRQKKQAK